MGRDDFLFTVNRNFMKGCEVCFTPITVGPGNFAKADFEVLQSSVENVSPFRLIRHIRKNLSNSICKTTWIALVFEKVKMTEKLSVGQCVYALYR
jgi:hypothetical protein